MCSLFTHNLTKVSFLYLTFCPSKVSNSTPVVREKAHIIDSHESQIYEWLPWINKSKDVIPETKAERLEYVLNEYVLKRGVIKAHDLPVIEKFYGSSANEVRTIEAFEICEFGRTVTDHDIRELLQLFPYQK